MSTPTQTLTLTLTGSSPSFYDYNRIMKMGRAARDKYFDTFQKVHGDFTMWCSLLDCRLKYYRSLPSPLTEEDTRCIIEVLLDTVNEESSISKKLQFLEELKSYGYQYPNM